MRQAIANVSTGLNRARTLTALLLLCIAPGVAAADWDIFGLRLGMTEAEARAALQAYDADGKLVDHTVNYSYSDNLQRFNTDPFLQQIELRVTRLSIMSPLRVWLSGPIGEARVIGITRQENNLPNPATSAQFKQSLIDKYGAPTENFQGIFLWEAPGKPSCVRMSWGIDLLDTPQLAMGHKKLEDVARNPEARRQTEPSLPADLTTCGTFMFYTVNMEPTTAFTAGLFDIGAIVANQYRIEEWVGDLEAEAIRKREGQGQAPQL